MLGGKWFHDHRAEASGSRYLTNAASSEESLMSEVAILNPTTERARCVGHTSDKDAFGDERSRDQVEGFEHLVLFEVLKQISGRNCRNLRGSVCKPVSIVTFADLVQSPACANATCSGLMSIPLAS